MLSESRNTIFALASASGRSGVAIFRLSGPKAKLALKKISSRSSFKARVLFKTTLKFPNTNEIIDEGMAVCMPAPASFTGEDVVELFIHGSPAVISALTKALSSISGLRLAEPGEFSKRAFENRKMDLSELEGLADLINADTESQRRQALRQLQGELGRLSNDWCKELKKSLAYLEASIDFTEEDLPKELYKNAQVSLERIETSISAHLSDGHRGERLREGIQIAIIGPVNAGKSSLLNLLVKRDIAIVSSRAGTTRDIIEAYIDLDGYPVILADTAGLRETEDKIEIEGARRAAVRAKNADLRILVIDQSDWPDIDKKTSDLIDENTLVVINKIDLSTNTNQLKALKKPATAVSVKTGSGIKEFLSVLTQEVSKRCHLSSEPSITRERHRQALEDCHRSILRALNVQENFENLIETELVAEDIRLALRSLGRITGYVDVEDVLDVIFKEFCIGK